MKYVIFDRADRPIAIAESEADAIEIRDRVEPGRRVLLRDDDSNDVKEALEYAEKHPDK